MLLFLDESGTDHSAAPYEVLAGVAIAERNLWPLIQSVRAAEREFFGMTLSTAGAEMKGKKLLKGKTFRFAAQDAILPAHERRSLAQTFLEKGQREARGEVVKYSRREFTAYGQAVLGFVERVFGLSGQFGVKVFGSMISTDAPQPSGGMLRKDYAYLFERFFYYLEDTSRDEMGLVVFDELERSSCRRLIDRMADYFLNTYKGQQRSSRILPEPFFVHSDLTTAIQIADLVAYSLNWGVRLKSMTEPTRSEMEYLGNLAFGLRYVGQRPDPATDEVRPIYGLTYIDDLRPRNERTFE